MLMMKSWQIALVVLMMLSIELVPAEARRHPPNKGTQAGSVTRAGSMVQHQRYTPYPGPSQAGPSNAVPNRAGSSRTGQYQAGPSRTGQYQAGPSQAGPSWTGPPQAAASETGQYHPLKLVTSGVYQCMTGVDLLKREKYKEIGAITNDLLNGLKRQFPGNAFLNSIIPPKKLMDLTEYIKERNDLEAVIDICEPSNGIWSPNDLLKLCVDKGFRDDVAKALNDKNPITTQDLKNYLVGLFIKKNLINND